MTEPQTGAQRRQRSSARHDLLRHRQLTLHWGLFIGLAALIVGAIAAPHLTLLVFLALLCFGTVGVLTSWITRVANRWIDGQ